MANQFTQHYTTYLDTWRRNVDPQRQFAAQQLMAGQGSSGGGSDTLQTLKMVTELQKIKKARSGATVNPAAVLQALMKLEDTRAQAITKNNAQIGKIAKELLEQSKKTEGFLDWRTQAPNVEKAFNNATNTVEEFTSNNPRADYGTAWVNAASALSTPKYLKEKDKRTRDALLRDVALQAKNAAGNNPSHMDGYKAISNKFFNGRDPVEYIQTEYKTYDAVSAQKEAQRSVPNVANLDDQINAMRTLANREFGYPLAEGQKVTPDMVAQAKVGQADEIDKLISELITKSMGGQNMPGYAGKGARTNMAQMILGNALAMPPMIGAAAVGASPRVMRMALQSEREMAKYQRERIAFEDKYGYAPGTRRFEDVPKPPVPQEQVTVGTVLPGEDEFGGNFYGYMAGQLDQASALMGSKDAEEKQKGVGITTALLEQIGAFPASGRESIARGMGYSSYAGKGGFFEAIRNGVSPNDLQQKVNAAIEDPRRYEFGDVGAIYEDFLNKIETDEPNNPKTYLKNVQSLRQFIAVLPENVRGEYGDRLLRQINDSFGRMKNTGENTRDRQESFGSLQMAIDSYRDEAEEDLMVGQERRSLAQQFRAQMLEEPPSGMVTGLVSGEEPGYPLKPKIDLLKERLEEFEKGKARLARDWSKVDGRWTYRAGERGEIESALASLKESLTPENRAAEKRAAETRALLKEREGSLYKLEADIRRANFEWSQMMKQRDASDPNIEALRSKLSRQEELLDKEKTRLSEARDTFLAEMGGELDPDGPDPFDEDYTPPNAELVRFMSGENWQRQLDAGVFGSEFDEWLEGSDAKRQLKTNLKLRMGVIGGVKSELDAYDRTISERVPKDAELQERIRYLQESRAKQKGLVEGLRAKVESLPQTDVSVDSKIGVQERKMRAFELQESQSRQDLKNVQQNIDELEQAISGIEQAQQELAPAPPPTADPVDTGALNEALAAVP